MIELNLLPDVKLSYIKAQRTRSLMITLSVLISVGSVVLLVLLLSFGGLEKKHLSDLRSNVADASSTLKNEPQINKILTVQNQLESLTDLHASKPAASELFTYLNQVTPVEVSIGEFTIDFTQQTATITGSADSLSNINKYVDTLKYTTYRTPENTSAQPAFSNVVLSSFSVSDKVTDLSAAANYTITLSYDQNIFDITQGAQLTVPTTTTTRVGLDSPNDLFKASTTPATTTKKGSQ